MNTKGFGFEPSPPAADGPADDRRNQDARAPTRASPDADASRRDDDPRGEEPPDEPGYGHGV
jgi:hypothetical protein